MFPEVLVPVCVILPRLSTSGLLLVQLLMEIFICSAELYTLLMACKGYACGHS